MLSADTQKVLVNMQCSSGNKMNKQQLCLSPNRASYARDSLTAMLLLLCYWIATLLHPSFSCKTTLISSFIPEAVAELCVFDLELTF